MTLRRPSPPRPSSPRGRGGKTVKKRVSTSTADALTKIYAVIQRIPEGKVATYGQVAALAGLPRRARLVGAALRNTPEGLSLPWQRVINAGGTISRRGGLGMEEGYQRHLLEEEGVRFNEHGRIDLERFRWDPGGSAPRRRGLLKTRKA